MKKKPPPLQYWLAGLFGVLVAADFVHGLLNPPDPPISWHQFVFAALALMALYAEDIKKIGVSQKEFTIEKEVRMTPADVAKRALQEERDALIPRRDIGGQSVTEQQEPELAKKIVEIEGKALQKFADLFGVHLSAMVTEPVAFGGDAQFDGALHRDQSGSILFEVKLVRDETSLASIEELIPQFNSRLTTFKSETGREPRFVLLLVVPDSMAKKLPSFESLYNAMQLLDYDWDLNWFTYEELELDLPAP